MSSPGLLRQSALVAGKDLRIEVRSRVVLNQVVPFGGVVLFLFAFALDPDSGVLRAAAPGLFWITVLLAALLALGRTFAIESDRAVRDALRLSGLDGGAVFLGKAAAIVVQLLVLEVFMAAGVVVLFDMPIEGLVVLTASAVTATAGLAACGVLYGVLAAGAHMRETLLPLLVLPVTAPVLLSATRAWEAGLDGVSADAWPWVGLLAVFTAIYMSLGFIAFEPLLEEA